MTEVLVKMYRVEAGLFVSVSYDTGWNEGLQVSGKGGYEYTLEFDPEGVAELKLRDMKNVDDFIIFRVMRDVDGIMTVQSQPANASIFQVVWDNEDNHLKAVIKAARQFVDPVLRGHVEVPRS